ncbi:MAG: MgtC/SapB family protein [Pseudomonadales bacterium]
MVMTQDSMEMLLRLFAALIAGAMIGYERTYHGRPAGFRTHALVCTAACLLMLVTVYEAHWVRGNAEIVRIDPTRMAQGIMTGIGFLGAGVIMQEGLSVRGLTTAASIWITSAIGILAGIGFYFPLVVSVTLTIAMLSVFRWIEIRMPAQTRFRLEVRLANNSEIPEDSLLSLIEGHGFSIADVSYRFEGATRIRYQSMVLRTNNRVNAARLSKLLETIESVYEFSLTPVGN